MRALSVVLRVAAALCLVGTVQVVSPPSVARAACPDPGTYQVVLYTDWNYGSNCVTLGVGNYPNASSMGITNDWTSSVKVGSGVRAALFEHSNYGGWEATYTGNADSMGGANDEVSSAVISYDYGQPLWKWGQATLNETWTQDAQGLAVQPSVATFITQETKLWRFPAGQAYTGTCQTPGLDCEDIPVAGYNHMGDPEYYNGHVLIPLEGSSPAVAVFRASDLLFEGWDYLGSQATNAAWVAVDPSSHALWSSDGNIQNTSGNRLWHYALDWNQLCTTGPGPGCDFVGTGTSKNLYRRNGSNPDLRGMQGGDFTTDGYSLYLSNGSDGCSGGDWDGMRLFDVSSGYLVAQGDDQSIGQFAVEVDCGAFEYEEMEGLDVDASTEVHVFVLDNESGHDHVFWKTYMTYN